MTRNGTALLAFALLLIAGAEAHADGDYISPTNERMRLSLGIMQVSAATSLRLDNSAGQPGTFINAENDFGLERSRINPKFQFVVRAGKRHRVRIDYFGLDRNDTKILTQGPIAFRNVILQQGDPVQSDLSLRALEITYGYSFWHSERLEIASTIGINEVDISARARVQTQTVHIDQREDQAGPYPVLGIDATWVASRRFYFDGRAQYLKVAINHRQGSLGLYELDALYRFRPNVAFALGYHIVKASLASTQGKDAGLFDFRAKGLEMFVRVAF